MVVERFRFITVSPALRSGLVLSRRRSSVIGGFLPLFLFLFHPEAARDAVLTEPQLACMECLPRTGTVEASDWVGKLKIDESVVRYLVSQVAKFLGRKVPVGFGGGIDCFVAELANVGTLGKFPLPDGFLWLVEIVERAVAIATEGLTAIPVGFPGTGLVVALSVADDEQDWDMQPTINVLALIVFEGLVDAI